MFRYNPTMFPPSHAYTSGSGAISLNPNGYNIQPVPGGQYYAPSIININVMQAANNLPLNLSLQIPFPMTSSQYNASYPLQVNGVPGQINISFSPCVQAQDYPQHAPTQALSSQQVNPYETDPFHIDVITQEHDSVPAPQLHASDLASQPTLHLPTETPSTSSHDNATHQSKKRRKDPAENVFTPERFCKFLEKFLFGPQEEKPDSSELCIADNELVIAPEGYTNMGKIHFVMKNKLDSLSAYYLTRNKKLHSLKYEAMRQEGFRIKGFPEEYTLEQRCTLLYNLFKFQRPSNVTAKRLDNLLKEFYWANPLLFVTTPEKDPLLAQAESSPSYSADTWPTNSDSADDQVLQRVQEQRQRKENRFTVELLQNFLYAFLNDPTEKKPKTTEIYIENDCLVVKPEAYTDMYNINYKLKHKMETIKTDCEKRDNKPLPLKFASNKGGGLRISGFPVDFTCEQRCQLLYNFIPLKLLGKRNQNALLKDGGANAKVRKRNLDKFEKANPLFFTPKEQNPALERVQSMSFSSASAAGDIISNFCEPPMLNLTQDKIAQLLGEPPIPSLNVMAQDHHSFSSNQPAPHLLREDPSMSSHSNVARQPKRRRKAKQGQNMLSSNTFHTPPQSSDTPTSLSLELAEASSVSNLPEPPDLSQNDLAQLVEWLQESSSGQAIEPSITSLQEPSSSTTTTTTSFFATESSSFQKSIFKPKKSTLDKLSDYLDEFLKDSASGKVRTDIYVEDVKNVENKYLIIKPKGWTQIVGKIQLDDIRTMVADRLKTLERACEARINKPLPIKVKVFGKKGLKISGLPSHLTCEQMCGVLSTFLKSKLTYHLPEKRRKELSSFEKENPLFFVKPVTPITSMPPEPSLSIVSTTSEIQTSTFTDLLPLDIEASPGIAFAAQSVDESLPPDELECVLSHPTILSPLESQPLEVPGPALFPSESALIQEPSFLTGQASSSFGRTSPTLFTQSFALGETMQSQHLNKCTRKTS